MLVHVLGLSWVVGAAVLVLVPALHHGLSLGPYDLLSQSGLTKTPGVTLRNSANGDQLAEMIPWSTLAWTQVHHGHLPLWNPYSGLGLPLAFNWQSAVFSLPAVISYAFPLHLAYTVQILATLVIAGTGAYALARVLHVGVIGCATAGTIFELSGSFVGWLGYPHAAVMSWSGWLLAVTVLIVRGRHRARNIVAFAVVLALAVFAGQPEILTMLVVAVVVVALTMVILEARAARNRRSSLRPLLDVSIATVAGIALGAPLALPGAQVLSGSTRNSAALLAQTEVGKALPPHDLVHLLVQGYNGLPTAGSQVFGDAVYFDTAAYVGVIAVALAVLGVARGWRRSGVVAIAVLAAVAAVIVFAPPAESIFLHLPFIQTVDWHRDLMMLGLCLAVLAGVGMDALVRGSGERSTHLLLGGMFAGSFILLLALWLFGASGLSPLDARLRRDSLVWPLVTAGLALVIVGVLAVGTARNKRSVSGGVGERAESEPTGDHHPDHGRVSHTRRLTGPTIGRVVGGLLLLMETVFLVASGAQLWSSSAQGARPSPAVASLARAVGKATVGFGGFTCYSGPASTTLGILPESNILFGVHEFDFYDPILPHAYFESWAEVSPSPAGIPIFNSFCPNLTTASQARRFGVEFVLVPSDAAGPQGSVFDRRVGNEDLYRIPDSGEATLTPEAANGSLPATDAPGTQVAVAHPSPSSWKMTTTGQAEQVLRLRLTDVPGWHASIDGHPLTLVPYAGVMMQARIPPGRHLVELHYWPSLFTLGLIVSALSFLSLLTALVVARTRRQK